MNLGMWIYKHVQYDDEIYLFEIGYLVYFKEVYSYCWEGWWE